jgi:hypothetical protein
MNPLIVTRSHIKIGTGTALLIGLAPASLGKRRSPLARDRATQTQISANGADPQNRL